MRFFGARKARITDEPETGAIILGGEKIPFTVTRTLRRKRTIAFAMEPETGLRVMAPVRTNLAAITVLLQNRSGWILSKIAERQKAGADSFPRRFADGETVHYMGHGYRLCVTHNDKAPQGCRIKPRRFEVNIPGAALSEKGLRQEVRLEILLWLKKRARIKFQKRMDLWAGKLDVKYRKLIVTGPERRWGSCSAQDVIRLNWRLIMAPLPLIDYVAAHELCHVAHKNHSIRFWKFLAAAMSDYQARRKQLRHIGHRLVLPRENA